MSLLNVKQVSKASLERTRDLVLAAWLQTQRRDTLGVRIWIRLCLNAVVGCHFELVYIAWFLQVTYFDDGSHVTLTDPKTDATWRFYQQLPPPGFGPSRKRATPLERGSRLDLKELQRIPVAVWEYMQEAQQKVANIFGITKKHVWGCSRKLLEDDLGPFRKRGEGYGVVRDMLAAGDVV